MAGLRLHHPTERDCIWLVRHPRKDYYLRLDSEGYVIVSQTVFDRLKEVSLAGLVFMNEVADPPTLVIGGNGHLQERVVFNPVTGQIEERKVVEG
jgi:hypothetical protein